MHRSLPAVAISALLIPACAGAQEVATRGPVVITITKADCSQLVRHIPSADVAYQPGVDVHGRKVAAADLDPAAAQQAARMLPDVLEIPLTINPVDYARRKAANKQKATAAQQVLQDPSNPALRQAYADADIAAQRVQSAQAAKGLDAIQTKVGTVKYDIAKNSFTFNDQPLLSEDQQRLAEACARQGVR